MIRFVSALLVGLALVGSVAMCQLGLTRNMKVFPESASEDSPAAGQSSEGAYRLVLTPTFGVEEDPFALERDAAFPAARIRISRGGRDLVRWTKDVRRGESIQIEEVSLPGDLVELFVEAVPGGSDAMQSLALWLQVMRGDVVYGDETLWTPGGGAPLASRVVMELRARHDRLDRGLRGGDS